MTYVRKRSTRPVRAVGNPTKVYKLRVARHGHGIRIPAAATRDHVRWLLDLGLTVESIAQAAGVGYSTVHTIARDRQTLVDGRIAAALARVSWRPTDRQTVVLAVGARRRLEALVHMGYTQRWICEQLGIRDANLRPTFDKTRCAARHWRAMRDLYDRYAMTPGPSDRARRFAASRGYLPPLAWDDDTIDDPAAKPAHDLTRQDYGVDRAAVDRRVLGDHTVTLTRPERWLVVQCLHAEGLSDSQIAARAGLVDRTVLRDRQTLGLPANHTAGREQEAS